MYNNWQQTGKDPSVEGRLLARPAPPTEPGPAGAHWLGLDPLRDGILYVPAAYQPTQPAPLAVMLHGAGGTAQHGIGLIQQLADASGVIILAPDSRRSTWDVIVSGYGPDVAFIDQALQQTFRRCAIDQTHLAIGGFSDGASYALSLGISNGELFSHIIAFSPGFMAPLRQEAAPRLFVSHGIHDDVLPIDRCSRRIVPQLQHAGYDLQYHEFDGPHTVPLPIAYQALEWFLA